MALQFITGGSGSGKSTALYNWIIRESEQKPNQKYYVVVPEQFTLQTERQLVALHPSGGILNIDVLSFQHLAYRILDKAGYEKKNILTETGKNLIIRRSAGEVKDKLVFLGGRLKRQGYVSEVKSAISEFAQYGIGDDALDEMIGRAQGEHQPLLVQKLKDLKVLYASFRQYIQNRFITGEELLEVASSMAAADLSLQNAVFVFDGFTGFTPVQIKMLRELLGVSRDIRIVLTMDPREVAFQSIHEHELFYLSKTTIQRISGIARDMGVEILDPVVMEGNPGRFFQNGELAFLEKNLYRPGWRTFRGALSGKQEISVHVSQSPSMEAAFAARTVLRLMKEEGYRRREIAVIAGDLSVYRHHLERAFRRYHIPVFVDRKVEALLNPCLEMIRAALEIIEKNYSYESMMAFLKTGFAKVPEGLIDRADNYCLERGIRGRKRWQEEWTYPSDTEPEEKLQELNKEVREPFFHGFEAFAEKLQPSRANVSDYVQGVRILLETFSVKEQLEMRGAMLRAEGKTSRAMEYEQIYEVVLNILDEADNLLNGEIVHRKEFVQILEAGFEEARIGLVPPGLDQVYIGDLERTRLSDIRALIFVGLNDGLVPHRKNNCGILSEMERDFLTGQSFELAPGARMDSYTQRFYQYLCLTKPSGRLILSYSGYEEDGKELRPSHLITLIRKMFPDMVPGNECSGNTGWERLQTYETGLSVLADTLREAARDQMVSDPAIELVRQYAENEAYAAAAEMIEKAAFDDSIFREISRDTAGQLYGDVLSGSVSKMETYAFCPYWFFARYGLKLMERKEYRIQATDIGTLIHEVMERFSAALTNSETVTWHNVQKEQWQGMLREILGQVQQEHPVFFDSARNKDVIRRIGRILERSIWAAIEQVRAGSFEPDLFEEPFVDEEIGEGLRIRGQIDRIDVAEKDGNLYVKVVDYKSGEKDFKLSELYDGRQLQLSVYLAEAMKREAERYPGRTVIPAGVFFSNVKDPVVNGSVENLDAGDTPQMREALLKEIRPKGMINSSLHVLSLFSEDQDKLSLYTPISLKKDGTPRKNSSAATQMQLEKMAEYAREKLNEYSTQIRDGKILPYPYKNGGSEACTYCEYREACGFDKKLPGASCRIKTVLDDSEIWEKIMGPEEEDGTQLDG